MKNYAKIISVFLLFAVNSLFAVNNLFAQEQDYEYFELEKEAQNGYFGLGMGFDYGGLFGLKFEYLPVKQFGLFISGGHNMVSMSYSVGCSYKITPDNKVCPNLMVLYGYNGAFKGFDDYSSQYDMVSYGFSFGAGFDFLVGRKNKISLGLFIPIQSKEFKDNNERAKDDSNMKTSVQLPIAFSIGFNFGLSNR